MLLYIKTANYCNQFLIQCTCAHLWQWEGEIPPPQNLQAPLKMLRRVMNNASNANIQLSKFACPLPMLVP